MLVFSFPSWLVCYSLSLVTHLYVSLFLLSILASCFSTSSYISVARLSGSLPYPSSFPSWFFYFYSILCFFFPLCVMTYFCVRFIPLLLFLHTYLLYTLRHLFPARYFCCHFSSIHYFPVSFPLFNLPLPMSPVIRSFSYLSTSTFCFSLPLSIFLYLFYLSTFLLFF